MASKKLEEGERERGKGKRELKPIMLCRLGFYLYIIGRESWVDFRFLLSQLVENVKSAIFIYFFYYLQPSWQPNFTGLMDFNLLLFFFVMENIFPFYCSSVEGYDH